MKATFIRLDGTRDFFTQECYKTLRTNVQFCGQDIRVIAVTSCHENEGKTVISLNLAKSLAELGKKVLLIVVPQPNARKYLEGRGHFEAHGILPDPNFIRQ